VGVVGTVVNGARTAAGHGVLRLLIATSDPAAQPLRRQNAQLIQWWSAAGRGAPSTLTQPFCTSHSRCNGCVSATTAVRTVAQPLWRRGVA
jgi:hypothetical protein